MKHALAFVVLLTLAFGDAFAEKRVALVIGNATYANDALNLGNPVNDANALSLSLQAMGFNVDLQTDQTVADMNTAIDRFRTAAEGAEMAVFFYAGHGVQVDSKNHLLARGFADQKVQDLRAHSVQLDRVKEALRAANPEIGIIIVDACRHNPFVDLDDVEQGLAVSSGGVGTLIAYATDPGNVAYDGAGKNSIFTEALLSHIQTPELDVRLMFGRVRQDVVLRTNGAQVPWVEEAVIGTHSFNQSEEAAGGNPDLAQDIARWRQISSADNAEDYRQYLLNFPDGLFREFAEARLSVVDTALASSFAEGSEDPFRDAINGESRAQFVTALAALGLVPSDDPDAVSDAIVERGIAKYRTRHIDRGVATPAALLDDAARTIVLFGVSTGQQLRADLVALSSLEKALGIAKDAYHELVAEAGNDPAAKSIIAEAAHDIQIIERRRERLLTQLDESREYYHDLINTGRKYMPKIISNIALSNDWSKRQIGGDGDKVIANIKAFARHVQLPEATNIEGSYAWLKDFLPGS